MKFLKCLFPLIWLASALGAEAQGTIFTLNAGESLLFQFNGLPLISSRPSTSFAAFSIQITPLSLPSQTTFRIETFENSLAEAPLRTIEATGPWPDPEWASFTPGSWQDLQGMARVTMLAGSARFAEPFVEVQIPSGPGAGEYSAVLTPVPEPASLALLILFGAAFGILRRKRVGRFAASKQSSSQNHMSD